MSTSRHRAVRRCLVRIIYLLPAISLLVFLIHALIPHIFFVHDGVALDTHSSFGLAVTAWDHCRAVLVGTTKGSELAVFFSYGILAFLVLAGIALILYVVSAIAAAVCSVIAFSGNPTDQRTNLTKRWFRFFCPNRWMYVISLIFPLLYAAFPQVLLHFYRSAWNYRIALFFYGPSDLILVGVLVAVNVLGFLILLPTQANEHLDLFRLYKAKPKESLQQ